MDLGQLRAREAGSGFEIAQRSLEGLPMRLQKSLADWRRLEYFHTGLPN
jgi:hypothetical protein